MSSEYPSYFSALLKYFNQQIPTEAHSSICLPLIKNVLISPDKCFSFSKSNNCLEIILKIEEYRLLNQTSMPTFVSKKLLCWEAEIIRSFKTHITQQPIDEKLLHTSYGCNKDLKTRMKELINASNESFAQWADREMKELQSLRNQCQNSIDREAIFCLITLETRLFSCKNSTLNKSFEAFKAHLNDKTLDIIAYPAHQYKMYETLPHDIVYRLNNIKSFTPNWLSRCINRFLALFATRPQSFFETHHASQLINKVSTHSLVAGV